jgi:glycosyltransferase involved in cell wall biosynthesis
MYQNRLSLQGNLAAGLSAGHGRVIIVCPGGLEDGGGIGRQMGYFLRAIEAGGSPATYRVVDSRGPWFLGAARIKSILSVAYLLGCLVRLLAARFSRVPVLAHINITGRGSTLRKMVLVAAARATGLRYLLHVHDYDYAADYFGRRKSLQSVVRWMFQGAERVIVLGARDKMKLETELHLSPSRVVVLHNAVPDPRLQHKDAPGRTAGGPVRLLFLGYLSERKGVPELLAALGSDRLKHLNWHATLAGGGDSGTYRDMAVRNGIADRVAFPGWIDRPGVDAACAAADILVLPSHAEGLAMSVLEGLAHGMAVVTTPVGAHTEVIENDISGLLVPPGDAKALAECLGLVIEDRDLRARLQQGARRRFEEKFEVTAYATRLSALHASLLADVGN